MGWSVLVALWGCYRKFDRDGLIRLLSSTLTITNIETSGERNHLINYRQEEIMLNYEMNEYR